MRSFSSLSLFLGLLAFAGESVIKEDLGPHEFSEEEIQKEMDANKEASTGKLLINSFDVQWSPGSIVVHGSPQKIAQEAATIRESLQAFPFLAGFAKYVNVSADSKSLDLSVLLKQIEKKLPANCYGCFSLPLCAMKKKFRHMDSADLLSVIDDSHVQKKEKDLGPGSVVLYRENYHLKEPYHAYIWLSPTLALEKRGSGYLLIRPQKAVEEDYKELARLERKSFKLMAGNKLPSLSTPLTKEYWVKK